MPCSMRVISGSRVAKAPLLDADTFEVAPWMCARSDCSFTSGWCRRNQLTISDARNGSVSTETHSSNLSQIVRCWLPIRTHLHECPQTVRPNLDPRRPE